MSTDPSATRPAPGAAGPADDRRAGPPSAGFRRGRGRKVRKVHRVIRPRDLWQAADRVGTIEGIEGFFEDAGGYDSFEVLGDVVFQAAAVTGLLLSGLAVFGAVLGALLFNLISDLTGGIRLTVIDEDLIVAPARRRTGPPGAPGPASDGRESGPPPDRTAERPTTAGADR